MPTSKPTNLRWLIVLFLMGFAFLGHFNRVSISVAGSERFIGPDGMTEEQMGTIYSAFLLVYTIGMLPGGWLIDRLGPRLALAGMGLGMGICVILTGLLGWFGMAVATLFLPLLAIRGLAGGMSVPLHPAAARSVSLWVPLAGRSTANGLVTAGALVGIAVTYPVFGWLMDRFDWPMAFVICGATFVFFAIVWFFTVSDKPAEFSDVPLPRPSIREFSSLLRNRGLVLLTLSYGAVGYVQYLFFYWIEHYFKTVLKLASAESREAAFTITLSMAVGMACGGWLSDHACRWLGHYRGCRLIAFVGMGLGAAFSLLGVSTTNPQEIVLFFSLALGSLGICEGIFWTTAPIIEARNPGMACSLVNTGGNGVGMLAPVLTPVIGNAFGWNAAIIVACVVCAVGGSLWFGIRPKADSAGLTT